jgi:hypothetical protein
MVAALSHTNIYPGFSTGNKVHKYCFRVWTLSGLRMWFVARNKRGGWLSLRWLWTTNLSTQTKSWMGDLSSQVRSCLLCCFVTACSTGLHLPNVLVHSFACIIAPSTWWFRFESLPCSLCLTCLHDIPAKQILGCPPCLYFACGLIKDVGGASRDGSWCVYG